MPKSRRRPAAAAKRRRELNREFAVTREPGPLTVGLPDVYDKELDRVLLDRGWTNFGRGVGLGDAWEYVPSRPDDQGGEYYDAAGVCIVMDVPKIFQVDPPALRDAGPRPSGRLTYEDRNLLIADLDRLEQWRWPDQSPPSS